MSGYVIGWLGYFGISNTYKQVLKLGDWMRRRVRLYYWKQWKQPRTRRRNLIKLGANPTQVKLATRSCKGYWRMSSNSIVQAALNNAYLHGQGVPGYESEMDRHALREQRCSRLNGTARCRAARRVVWDLWPIDSVSRSRGPNWAPFLWS